MYYSQFGEDRRLAKIFQGRSRGVCIEVGANNGVDGSTTLHFEERGWDCVLVEPTPLLCREIRSRRTATLFECAASDESGVAVLHVATGADGAHAVSALGDHATPAHILRVHGYNSTPVEVPTRKLDDILNDANLKSNIDFISIDVERHELPLLKGFSLNLWRPIILIVEDNSNCWRSEVSEYLKRQDYVRFYRTGVNDWYAHISNQSLANAARRMAYFPSMLVGRGLIATLKLLAPVLPVLRRAPGALLLRDFLFGRRGGA